MMVAVNSYFLCKKNLHRILAGIAPCSYQV
nr:MAG TPA: hypothetical protein [Bacteriophage sp.]